MKEYLKKKRSTIILQSWYALLIVIFAQMVSAIWMIIFDEGSSIGLFLMYTTGMSLALLGIVALKKSSEGPYKPIFQTQSVPLSLYSIVLIAIPAMMMISGPIANLLPIPDEFSERLQSVLSDSDIFTFLTIAIAAPILEELLFRGIILDGLLRNVTPKKAIIHSAIIFSVAHMNPLQVPQTLVLGLFIGWIYYRTRSIWPCIFIHFINNGSVFLLIYLSDFDASAQTAPPDISPWILLAVVPVGMTIVYAVIRMIETNFPSIPTYFPSVPTWEIGHTEEE